MKYTVLAKISLEVPRASSELGTQEGRTLAEEGRWAVLWTQLSKGSQADLHL